MVLLVVFSGLVVYVRALWQQLEVQGVLIKQQEHGDEMRTPKQLKKQQEPHQTAALPVETSLLLELPNLCEGHVRNVCTQCKPGDGDGAEPLVNLDENNNVTVCPFFCSHHGHCGSSTVYSVGGSTDCRQCAPLAVSTVDSPMSLGSAEKPARVDFLVAVLSARGNFERRQETRRLWATALTQRAHERGLTVPVVFIIGGRGRVGEAPSLSTALAAERNNSRDLFLLNDVLDVYDNSAVKMIEFYAALHQLGLQHSGVIKMDDDTVLFPERLLQMLDPLTSPCWFSALSAKERTRGCQVESAGAESIAAKLYAQKEFLWWGNFRVREPVHRPPNAWSVERSVYSPDQFPPYASGPTHLMSGPLVRWYGVHASGLERGVWMEDVAHALWFDQAASSMRWFVPVCYVFDYRFAIGPPQCHNGSFAIGSLLVQPQKGHEDTLTARQNEVDAQLTVCDGRKMSSSNDVVPNYVLPSGAFDYALEHYEETDSLSHQELALSKNWPLKLCTPVGK